jgi:predicted RNA-binding Zn-ribbon protein involved in translation (DUF1610 family)
MLVAWAPAKVDAREVRMTVRCPVCGEELESEAGLDAHDHEVPVIVERAGAGFACPTCGRQFDGEEELVAHEAEGHADAGGPQP